MIKALYYVWYGIMFYNAAFHLYHFTLSQYISVIFQDARTDACSGFNNRVLCKSVYMAGCNFITMSTGFINNILSTELCYIADVLAPIKMYDIVIEKKRNRDFGYLIGAENLKKKYLI